RHIEDLERIRHHIRPWHTTYHAARCRVILAVARAALLVQRLSPGLIRNFARLEVLCDVPDVYLRAGYPKTRDIRFSVGPLRSRSREIGLAVGQAWNPRHRV